MRWDREDRRVQLYTADRAEARKWARLGYAVDVQDCRHDGTPRSWRAVGPDRCVRLRRVKGGRLVKRVDAGRNLPMYRRTPSATFR